MARKVKEITLELTDYCPHGCDFCSSNARESGEQFIDPQQAFDLLREQGPLFDRINISGGEPLAHPGLWRILQLCKIYLYPGGQIVLYTNAIDAVAFNVRVRSGVKVLANVPLDPGVDEIHLLKLVNQGREAQKPILNFSCNWPGDNDGSCDDCVHPVIRPDGSIASAPCRKDQ